MTAADDAYREAERLIAETKREGAIELRLDREETHALSTLPPSIAGLEQVTSLYLANTQIADVSPLAGMTGITRLDLGDK